MKLKQLPAIRHLLLFLAILLTFSIPAQASSTEPPADTAERLQQKYDSMTSLTFVFNQKTEGQLSGRPRTGTGKAFFLKKSNSPSSLDKKPQPGKMRWNYLAPDRQILLCDGNTFSMYFAKSNQMIITPADSLKDDLTYSFFTGSGRLVDDFFITEPAAEFCLPADLTSPYTVIRLTPKKQQSQISEIHLWITPESLIQRIRITDNFDTITILNLSHIELNTLDTINEKQREKLFSFTPPEGTEIIRQ